MRRRRHTKRAKNRCQKTPSPRHALAIIGRLIRRRIEKTTIYNKGVSLVHILHLGWRDKAQEPHPDGVGRGEDGEASMDDPPVENGDVTQVLPTNSDASLPSTSSSMAPPRAETTSHHSTPSVSGESEHHGIDTNINAIRHEQPTRPNRSRAKKDKTKRKTIKRRGLVARSIGRPKLTMSLRHRRAPIPQPSQNTKGSKKLKMLRRRLDKLKDDVQLIASSLTEEIEGLQFRETTTGEVETLGQESEASPGTHPLESSAPPPGEDAEPRPSEQRVNKRNKGRTRRQTLDLIDMFEAGPSHGRTDVTKDRGKHPRRTKRAARKPEGAFPKSVSRLSATSSSHLHTCGSSENPDWPSLPASGRLKGLVKETAKEIVKNKQSKSITGLTRRRWADIVAVRINDNTRSDQQASTSGVENNVFSPRTWASVASSSSRSDPMDVTSSSATENVRPVSASLSNGPVGCRKKKKIESKISNSDQLLVDVVNGKGKTQSLKCTRKKIHDRFDNCMKLKSQQQNRVQSDSDIIQSRDHKPITTSNQGETSSSEVRANETKKDGPSNWYIDNMSVVYTRPVASVISLNAPLEARAKQMNRCNNRSVTPSKTREYLTLFDVEPASETQTDPTTSIDLCDRMSMISFQSSCETNSKETAGPSRCKTRGNNSPRKASKHKRLANPANQKEVSKAAQDEVDPPKSKKKISLKYRALLRGESGRLDAKAVTEMTSRSKKTDSLQEDKLANRTLQRRQRQRRQEASHNLQRSPAVAAERQATRSADATPWCVPGAAAAPQRTAAASARADGASTSKRGVDGEDKSENSWDNHAHLMHKADVTKSMRKALPPITLQRPVSAQSAPELTRCHNKICLELHTIGKESLDIGWWHAYLHQIPESTCPHTDEPSTSRAL
ncbi:unnamed protein product [Lymnaea stagnalis]|uniref:Uncharacterized protein n=1 Tax=Lymnaea stagnalis TaxID=6523 RepID=A0AAV2HVL2_LYMST